MKKLCLSGIATFFLLCLLPKASIKSQSYSISTFAGNGVSGFSGDGGAATASELNAPSGVAIDGLGNIYISDTHNQRVRMVNTGGIISTIAGTGTAGNLGIGGAATAAELYYPYELTVDNSGNVFISDWADNVINRINTTGVISIFAGTGTAGYTGDGIPATGTELNLPSGIALDGFGNAYITDNNNNRVRMVNTGGIISTIAGNGYNSGSGYPGNGGYFGDGGPATSAELHWPSDINLDNKGNNYFSDQVNNCIRMVNTGGVISTVAGNGVQGFSGDGGMATAAELNNSTGEIVDVNGNIFLADFYNYRIRMVDTNGIISTIAGNGMPGYSGDGGAATSAELNAPQRLSIDALGNIYFCDQNNNVVRRLSPVKSTGIKITNPLKGDAKIYPNPNNGRFLLQLSVVSNQSSVEIYNALGEKVYSRMLNQVQHDNNINISSQPNGVYLYRVMDENGNNISNGKFVIQK